MASNVVYFNAPSSETLIWSENQRSTHYISPFKTHEGSFVSLSVAVIWCRENGGTSSIMLDGVTALTDLMGAEDSRDAVKPTPALCDVWPERDSHSPLARSTSLHRLRIGPEHLMHEVTRRRLSTEARLFPYIFQRNFIL